MNEIALIKGPSVTSAAWLTLIAQRDDLLTPPARMGKNPFTGEPVEFKPPATTVRVVRDDLDLGQIYLSEDGADELLVMAPDELRPVMLELAQELATALGGEVATL